VNHFEATVRREMGMTIINLSGTIDGGAEPELTAAYAQSEDESTTTVALSFDDVDYINSTGIALVVSLLAQARRDGRQIVAWGLTDHYREIFEITRLVDFLEIFADEQAARSACDTT
jgi:anti-sigma B factor antagonist